MAVLPPEYRGEPELALAGGEDGLDLVRRLLTHARRHLAPEGILVVEIGHNRTTLEAAYPRTPFTWLETHAGDEFVFLLTRAQLP
jgi:ribosomal protein L3 glutamine methyltransferase